MTEHKNMIVHSRLPTWYHCRNTCAYLNNKDRFTFQVKKCQWARSDCKKPWKQRSRQRAQCIIYANKSYFFALHLFFFTFSGFVLILHSLFSLKISLQLFHLLMFWVRIVLLCLQLTEFLSSLLLLYFSSNFSLCCCTVHWAIWTTTAFQALSLLKSCVPVDAACRGKKAGEGGWERQNM